MSTSETTIRTRKFCTRFGLQAPVLLAPMAGVRAPSLSVAVAHAGGLGACGVLLMAPEDIHLWAAEVRQAGADAFQLNAWIPDPPPRRDPVHEDCLREFLLAWGPSPTMDAAGAALPDFEAQCEAMLAVRPPVVSSIMGLYPPPYVAKLKQAGIAWFATVSTVREARAAEAAGADAIVAQGAEAGGHRGCFDAADGERQLVGSFALIPAVADAVRLPVVAAGGITDARGVAAALILGASAVQIGTGFLGCPEAGIHPAWARALASTAPEDTLVSRVFSGRPGRSIKTAYTLAATTVDAPAPAPYPVQRGLTAGMRARAQQTGDLNGMQAWAGQSAALAHVGSAGEVLRHMWEGALMRLNDRGE